MSVQQDKRRERDYHCTTATRGDHGYAMTQSQNAALRWIAQMSNSRFNGYAGLSADVIVALALLIVAFWRHDVPVTTMAAIVISGLLIFSLIEYCVHRWLFHGPISLFEQGHRRHHEKPMGYDALPFFLPPLAYLLLAVLLAVFMPVTAALLLAGSIAAGYAAYGLSHSIMHNFRFRNPWLRKWAAAHHVHHNHPERNFGVTSPLWDMLLRTQYISASKSRAR